MASKRHLKNKIRTVGNIRQITRAMEMVAATKMRRSQGVALHARPYAKYALRLLRTILDYATREDLVGSSHFFKRTGRKRTCLVVVTSDRGLCGGFNAQVLRKALAFKEEHPEVEIVAVGKKGRDYLARRGFPIAASFTDFSDIVTLQDVAPLADWLLTRYATHVYDTIVFCSTEFTSALRQTAEFSEILPLSYAELEKTIQRIVPKTGKYSELQHEEESAETPSYLVEPNPHEVFEELVVDLVHVEILHLIFESNASEHSARMLAMKNATENAENLQETLQLELNKARQAAITQELTEIATAKEALTSD